MRGSYYSFSLVLTPHQSAILQCVAEGLDYGQIAREFGIQRHTVVHHLQSIRERLGARTTAQAVYIAVRVGAIRG